MRMKILIAMVTALFSLVANCQTSNPEYNKALADSLGADDYGMKGYVFVILKTGPAKIESKQTVDSLFRGHLININRLAGLGKLVIAGPFKKHDRSYRRP